MRNIAAVTVIPSVKVPLTAEERRLLRAGIRSLRAYRHLTRSQRSLPTARVQYQQAA